MFVKAFILVLLGTSVVLANPVSQEAEETQTEASVKTKVSGWLSKAKNFYRESNEKLDHYWQKVKDKVQGTNLKEKFTGLKVVFEQAYQKLVNKFEELKKKSPEKIEELKKQFEHLVHEQKAKLIATYNNIAEKVIKIVHSVKNKQSNEGIEHKEEEHVE